MASKPSTKLGIEAGSSLIITTVARSTMLNRSVCPCDMIVVALSRGASAARSMRRTSMLALSNATRPPQQRPNATLRQPADNSSAPAGNMIATARA